MNDDPRLAEAQALPIDEIADRLGITAGLRRMSGELVGPCPKCGGHDRFGISIRKGKFLCRRCDGKGDGISLVQFVLGLDFQKALGWLMGERHDEVLPEEAARRRRVAEDDRLKREARSARERQKAIAAAHAVWLDGRPIAGTAVADYLDTRGLGALAALAPRALRFHADLPYTVNENGEWVTIHRGPAMLACIQPCRAGNCSDAFAGLHRTWIDLDQPKGKARIFHKGEMQAAKKTLGSVKGGAIRLVNSSGDPTIIMGEGIETTGAAYVLGEYPRAAYWAGVSLGNMGGSRKLGQGLKFAGIPDLSDEDAFVPPKQCRRLIFIQDGDSEPRLTRAILEAGLRRAQAKVPGLCGYIVHPGVGRDLNDVLMEIAHV